MKPGAGRRGAGDVREMKVRVEMISSVKSMFTITYRNRTMTIVYDFSAGKYTVSVKPSFSEVPPRDAIERYLFYLANDAFAKVAKKLDVHYNVLYFGEAPFSIGPLDISYRNRKLALTPFEITIIGFQFRSLEEFVEWVNDFSAMLVSYLYEPDDAEVSKRAILFALTVLDMIMGR